MTFQPVRSLAHVTSGWPSESREIWGSPHAFVLTREGWAYLKAERSRAPIRRAG